MLGKLTWEAVPLHEPIVVVTLAAMVLGGLALLGAVTYFKLWGVLWRDWFTTVDHKKIEFQAEGDAQPQSLAPRRFGGHHHLPPEPGGSRRFQGKGQDVRGSSVPEIPRVQTPNQDVVHEGQMHPGPGTPQIPERRPRSLENAPSRNGHPPLEVRQLDGHHFPGAAGPGSLDWAPRSS